MRTRTRRTTSTSQNKDEDEVMDSVCPHPPQILGEMGPDETGSDESARGDSVGAGSVGDESQTRAPKKSKQAARAENPNSKSVASSARAAGRSRNGRLSGLPVSTATGSGIQLLLGLPK